jgi:hypothetical protein
MPSEIKPQTDFSAGELDPEVKRDIKNPLTMAGARQLSNFRILNAKGVTNRPGRRALYLQDGRTERFIIAPNVSYDISFGNGTLRIRDATGTIVFTDTARPWTSATLQNIVWALYDKSIYITFPGMVPRVLTWDGLITWTAADFAEKILGGAQKRTLFSRIAPKGITLTVSALTGTINITFSAAVLVAGMVGTRIRFNGRQMTIATVTGPTTGTATINEPLSSNRQSILTAGFTSTPVTGDVVTGVGGAVGTVISVAAPSLVVELVSAARFSPSGTLFDGAAFVGTIVSVGDVAPGASVIWDQEVMNAYQGWPQSVFVDQNRLGFCNFPALPKAIAWSAVLDFTDFYPDAFAQDGLSTDAILEFVPGNRQVFFVIPGMDASEFVFCDRGLFYIQITPANPLKPGSVGFSLISDDEVGQVQPRRIEEIIVYVGAGLNSLYVVKIFGSYTRAYKTDCITDLSNHLFGVVKALAVMTASETFNERYMFALNADGSVVCGKYSLGKSNDLEDAVGFTPWSSSGPAQWVSCRGATILFTTDYTLIGGSPLVEQLDNSRYLDTSQLYNTQPSGLPIPGGKGPLWYIAGGSVDVMDGPLGTRMMGTYLVDANGFLIPQNNAGEDLTSANLVVGQAWTAVLEPFVPPAQGGQDIGQRIKKRRIRKAQVYVTNSTGFVMERLYSGQSGPLLPAYGTVMTQRRIEAWNQDEDPTQPPVLREQAYHDRPLGRSHDPRWQIAKDTSGPLTIEEVGFEVTI